MTPEELNRTIEFIIQSQARLAAAQEQDRIDHLQAEKESKSFDRRLAGLLEIQVRLLESQTRRLDVYEKESRAAEKRHEQTHRQMREEAREFQKSFREFIREMRDWQQTFYADVQKKHEETIAWLKNILEKLTDRLN
jgi:hypothetical protein